MGRPGYCNNPPMFWRNVEKGDGCWLWKGAKFLSGYGRFSGKGIRAHRWAWEQVKGPVPIGLVLDHLCRNKLCVNPSHLEAVTNWENTKRGTNFMPVWAARDCCIRGHKLEGANLRLDKKGRRMCVECRRIRGREDQRRRRERRIKPLTKVDVKVEVGKA